MRLGELLALRDGAREAFERLWLGYTETAGDAGLRLDIAELYDSVEPDDILVLAGGEEAIFTFANACLAPDDHVIVHYPGYQSLSEVPIAVGCDVSLWHARSDNSWKPDLQQLARAIRPATRAVLVNLPHNPTGAVLAPEEWEELIRIARHHGLVIFSDEAYRGLEYDGSMRLPAICDAYENGISLGLLSKGYGLPGLRIAWLATGNRELLEKIALFKDYTTICNSAPSEFLARIAVQNSHQLLQRSRGIIHQNLALVSDLLERHRDVFDWFAPLAGPITYPSLRGEGSVDDFCDQVLREAGVLLLPGTVFSAFSRNLRLGFGRADTAVALNRFDAFLSK